MRSRGTPWPVSYYLGGLATVLGRDEEANVYFTQAVVAGDIERARALLTQAHEAAAANGYATVDGRATAALQQLD